MHHSRKNLIYSHNLVNSKLRLSPPCYTTRFAAATLRCLNGVDSFLLSFATCPNSGMSHNHCVALLQGASNGVAEGSHDFMRRNDKGIFMSEKSERSQEFPFVCLPKPPKVSNTKGTNFAPTSVDFSKYLSFFLLSAR